MRKWRMENSPKSYSRDLEYGQNKIFVRFSLIDQLRAKANKAIKPNNILQVH